MSSSQELNELASKMRETSRRRHRRSIGALFAFFLTLALLLGLFGSSQILLVTILYTSILFGGFALAAFVLLSNVSWNVESLRSLLVGGPPRGQKRNNDIVDTLSIYVKFASRGSEYSRREIAHMLKDIMDKSDSLAANDGGRGREESNVSEGQFQKDVDRVVHSYTLDSKNIGKLNAKDAERFGLKRKASREEREAYLASLARITKRLRSS